jgi:pimeloyl-ACP methyl ester carboxylesterase
VKLGTGPQQLFAYTGGKPFDPTRPCVVFIHGAQHDHSVWILQSRYFAHHGFSVLAFDLPGHGRSDPPALESVEAMADSIVRALPELQGQRFVLVGHSMGSLIALEVARQLGDRVAGIALCGTAFPMPHSASIAPFAARPSNPGPGF